jgi:hypothetical protein
MTRKHAELERELIDDLLPRTGKTLAQWMAEIDAAGLAGKNEIIDWLRPRGFTFANASWLERIHNNGGRPIYLDTVTAVTAEVSSLPAARLAPRVEPGPPAPRALSPTPVPVAGPAPRSPAPTVAADPGGLAETLARGKAYRPLAEMVVRQIEAALPGVAVRAAGDLVTFGRPRELAVLHVSARELRLGLALGEQEAADPLVKAKIGGAGPHITHMVVLTDARQVGPALMAHVLGADRLANGG